MIISGYTIAYIPPSCMFDQFDALIQGGKLDLLFETLLGINATSLPTMQHLNVKAMSLRHRLSANQSRCKQPSNVRESKRTALVDYMSLWNRDVQMRREVPPICKIDLSNKQ